MLRKMWAETAQMLQKEFDDAGVDVKVPKDIPTRGDITREIGRALTPVTKPFKEAMDTTNQEIDNAKKAVTFNLNTPTAPKTPEPAKVEPTVTPPQQPADEKPASSNGRHDFGTWSQGDLGEEP